MMHLVLYVYPGLEDSSEESLRSLRLYCLFNKYKIVREYANGASLATVLKMTYNCAQGLIVPSLSHITQDRDFVMALQELKRREKHVICFADGIDTTLPGVVGAAFWKALEGMAQVARSAQAPPVATGNRTTKEGRAILKHAYKERKLAQLAKEEAFRAALELSEKVTNRENVTLAEAWADYRRIRKLKPATIFQYDRCLNYMADWMDLPIRIISADQVEERFKQITEKNGPTVANCCFRNLRAVINFARQKYEVDGEPIVKRNVVSRLSGIKAWNKEKPRTRILEPGSMKVWFQALRRTQCQTTIDQMLFLLFTGVRAGEARKLLWKHVDFQKRQVTFLDTKNGTDFCTPVSATVISMLARRHSANNQRGWKYVFSQNWSDKPAYINQNVLFKLSFETGVRISPHDCRRTFATVCDSLRFEHNLIKRLLNHTILDVTNRYIIQDPERFRKEIELVGATLQHLLGISDTTPVIGEVPPTLAIADVTGVR
jgi:integrase